MSLGRVLVVDDEPPVMNVLREMLQHLQYEASTAVSAEEALAAMVNVRPHVVILDLHLPGMPGLEALAYFGEVSPAMPVIVVTGRLEEEVARQARERGAFDVLTKPFSLAALRSLLAQAMKSAPPQ